MLSKPNVSQIMPKAGNRYESALALAKRARNIENRRLVEGSSEIRNAVDVAAEEIAEEESFVKIDGKYIVDVPDFEENKDATISLEDGE